MIDCPRGGAQCGRYLRRNSPDHNRICCNYECAISASLSPFSSLLPSRSATNSIVCRCSVDANCHTRTTLQHLNLHERECRLIRNQLRQSQFQILVLEESSARSATAGGDNERKRKRADEGIQEAQKKIEELERTVAYLNGENTRLRSKQTGYRSNGGWAVDLYESTLASKNRQSR